MKKQIIKKSKKLLQKTGLGDTLSHSLNYLIKSIATRGISIISIPIFTYLLTPDDYGILNIFTAYVSIAAIVLTFNTQVGIGRYYFEKQDDFGNLLFMSIILPLGLLFFFFILSVLFSQSIAGWLELPEKTIYFIVPSAIAIVLSNYVLQVFRARKESAKIRNYSIQRTYFSFFLAVILVYLFQKDRYMGRLWADVGVLIVFAFITFKMIGPFIRFQLKKNISII